MLDHGQSEVTIRDNLEGARAFFDELAEIGIKMDDVTDKLRVDGIESFVQSFDELLENLGNKQKQLEAAV